jgi:putative phosphoribosyl transferase
MYFHNRAEAGRKLAEELADYQLQNCTVIALTPGAVIIGAQIAIKIHAGIAILLTENVFLPGEPDALGALSSSNLLTYNDMFSTGQIEEFVSEYYNYIEQERLEKLSHLHRLLGLRGEIKRELLRNHTVIVVSDGLSNGSSLAVAAEFLKSIKVKKLVVATAVASIEAVDRMHLFADEVHCLSVVENYVNTNHYYDDNTIPDIESVFKIIHGTPVHWDRGKKHLTIKH